MIEIKIEDENYNGLIHLNLDEFLTDEMPNWAVTGGSVMSNFLISVYCPSQIIIVVPSNEVPAIFLEHKDSFVFKFVTKEIFEMGLVLIKSDEGKPLLMYEPERAFVEGFVHAVRRLNDDRLFITNHELQFAQDFYCRYEFDKAKVDKYVDLFNANKEINECMRLLMIPGGTGHKMICGCQEEMSKKW